MRAPMATRIKGVIMEWFMRPGDYDFSFIGMNEEWFVSRPAFGVAGGPVVVELSDAGWEFVFDFASVYRLKMNIGHVDALRFLLANGPTEIKNIPVHIYGALRELSLVQIGDPDEIWTKRLTLSLNGDRYEYDYFLDGVNLVRVVKSEYFITALGKKLILSACGVAESLINEYNRRKKEQS